MPEEGGSPRGATPDPGAARPRVPIGLLLWLVPVVALLFVIGYQSVRKQQPASITMGLARGQRPAAPAFELPRFDGGTLALSSLRGKYVLLNFWASWCIPCRDEAPLLERAWREYRTRGLAVVGVNIQDLEPEARKFIAEFKVSYPNVRDRDGRVSRAYGTTGVPESFFIDRESRVVRKFPGAAIEWRIWQEAIDGMMGAP